jgi:hypothetical protein
MGVGGRDAWGDGDKPILLGIPTLAHTMPNKTKRNGLYTRLCWQGGGEEPR